MLTSNRSDFRPYTRSASVTISNRRVRTRTHGGVAGVSGQPLPLCRSYGIFGNWPATRFRNGTWGQKEHTGYFSPFLRSSFSVRTNSLRLSKFETERLGEVQPSCSA